jgi:hypothetical protein
MAGGGGRGGSGSGEGSAHGWKGEACGGATGPRGCVGLADRWWRLKETRAHGGGGNGGRRVGGACKGGRRSGFYSWDLPVTSPWCRRCCRSTAISTGARTKLCCWRTGGPWRAPTGTARSMACARPGGFPDLGARRLGKEPSLEQRAALGGAASGAARTASATSRHDDALTENVLLSPCLKAKNSKFFNRTVLNFEYESCRPSYPLPLSKRLYRVFLTRFCRKCLSTLNATHLSWTGGTNLWASFKCISTQNLKCQSTGKLCPSISWTTFIKVDFEVFRWNLENAAKVPKDI